MRNKPVPIVAIAAIALSLMGCSGNSEVPDASSVPGVTATSIRLGTTNALTGIASATCKGVSDGALAWFEKVNADGGVNGRAIDNVVLDDAYDATKSLANARQLKEQGILSFFGGCGTIQQPAVMSVAEPDGIPYLFPAGAVPDLVGKPMFRGVNPMNADQFTALVNWGLKDKGPGRVYNVIQRVPGYETTLSAMQEGTKTGGGTIAGNEVITVGGADMNALALKIKQSGAEYVAASIGGADAARLLKALDTLDALPAKYMMVIYGTLSQGFLGPAGTLADGRVVASVPVPASSSPDAKSCVDVLTAKGLPLDVATTLQGCAFAQAMITALQDTKELSRDNLLKTIDGWKDKQASPLLTPLTFTTDRHIGASVMRVLGVKDGQPYDTGSTFPVSSS